jgi:hypothetical protein
MCWDDVRGVSGCGWLAGSPTRERPSEGPIFGPDPRRVSSYAVARQATSSPVALWRYRRLIVCFQFALRWMLHRLGLDAVV